MDKRTGRKTLNMRNPIINVGLPSYTLVEAVDFVIKVKRANNLKGRTISGYIQNMDHSKNVRVNKEKAAEAIFNDMYLNFGVTDDPIGQGTKAVSHGYWKRPHDPIKKYR